MCVEWMTTFVTVRSANGWKWRFWTLTSQVCITFFAACGFCCCCFICLQYDLCPSVDDLSASCTLLACFRGFESPSIYLSSGLPENWLGEPHIAENPKPQTFRQGTKFTLCCVAFGIPSPHYQWYRNGQPLPNKSGGTLQVRNACSRGAESDC